VKSCASPAYRDREGRAIGAWRTVSVKEGTECLRRTQERASRRIRCCSCVNCSVKKDCPVESGVIPPPFTLHPIRRALISDSCVNLRPVRGTLPILPQ